MTSGIGKVVVPVDDRERARQFWTSRMLRVVARNEPRREPSDELPHSPVFFNYALGQWS